MHAYTYECMHSCIYMHTCKQKYAQALFVDVGIDSKCPMAGHVSMCVKYASLTMHTV